MYAEHVNVSFYYVLYAHVLIMLFIEEPKKITQKSALLEKENAFEGKDVFHTKRYLFLGK